MYRLVYLAELVWQVNCTDLGHCVIGIEAEGSD